MGVKLVAHRGASRIRPENTLGAFLAARAEGADAIEFDVHQTLDGDLVVIHDYDLARTTNGTGLVHECSTAYIRQLDAGSWFAEEPETERVPLLEEVLGIPGIRFEMELKGRGRRFLARVLETTTAQVDLDRVEFTSPHPLVLSQLRHGLDAARIGVFVRPRPAWMSDDLHWHLTMADIDALHASVAHVPAQQFGPQFSERCHTVGVLAHAADAETGPEILRVVAAGADQVSTTDVAAGRAALSREGRRS